MEPIVKNSLLNNKVNVLLPPTADIKRICLSSVNLETNTNSHLYSTL